MFVTLLLKDRMYGVRLPEKVRGRYSIQDEETKGRKKNIEIEACDDRWVIRGNKALQLFDAENGQERRQLTLAPNKIYPVIMFREESQRGYLLTEPFTEDRCIYKKYLVGEKAALSIGTDRSNTIVIDNPFVSAKHAQLEWREKTWLVYDNESTNGTYVNQEKVSEGMVLRPGDLISILGCKIVVGNGFFSINNPDNSVVVRGERIRPFECEPCEKRSGETEEPAFYCRIPCFSQKRELFELKVDAPPKKERDDQTPIILTLAPSLMMGVASFASGIVTTTNTINSGGNVLSSMPTLLMSVSMLCGMVLFPFFMKRRERKIHRENERVRREKYSDYLELVRAEIERNCVLQTKELRETYPNVLERVRREHFWDGELWGITSEHPDFLRLRLGLGQKPLEAKISFPENRFSIEDDVMRNRLEEFRQEERVLRDVPACLSLTDYRICGIVGEENFLRDIIHNVLIQLAVCFGYDEVKLVFIGNEKILREFSYLPYFFHLWDNERKNRYLACTEEEVRELSCMLGKILAEQLEEKDRHKVHYVVVCVDKALEERCGALADIMKSIGNTGFSVLAFYGRLQDLPEECDCIISCDKVCRQTDKAGRLGGGVEFQPDGLAREKALEIAAKIYGKELDLNRGKYELPDMLTFLQMFGVGKYEHLNIQARWRENNPVLSLRTPIGVDTGGGTFYLDLHEKAHGPHGLIAGMTGSGKSEFIITLILSLAVNYRPDEIAFILIDYKGGGLAGTFDNEEYRLPHLAGTITNLDGSSINRSLVSIKSELRRRQSVFNAAREKVNEGTMDIYKYQKLYRDGITVEAMPHLLIISDEFAELKAQQPEFMEQLISTARIGRSLGVHLILATQKPAGVVNEQIWANSRFKICLKVQDRTDSNDMLKRPDAADITETGRFYLQVGYNELFEMGQSAWCGAPYIEESADSRGDESVELVNHLGRVVEKIKPDPEERGGGAKKQIVEILKYIAQIASEENLAAESLWLPALPAVVDCNQLTLKYGYDGDKGYVLNPVIGELDDPYNQKQEILTVPFTEKGNVLVYGAAGSGKNIFLTTLLYSLYRNHDGGELNTYLLDFGAETLRYFAKAPQTGEVILNGDGEKLGNLFRYLRKELEERKKLLSEYAGDYPAYCREAVRPKPNILVVINNYLNFVESYENCEDELVSVTRECTKYGIYFIITATGTSALRYKLLQNFNQSYVLRLNNNADYYSVVGNTGGIYPAGIKGRGIIRREDVYEFQTAYPCGSPDMIIPLIREFCDNLSRTCEGNSARKLQVMSEALTSETADVAGLAWNLLPYGVKMDSMELGVFDFKREAILQVIAREEKTIAPFVQGMAEVLVGQGETRVVCFDLNREFAEDRAAGYQMVQQDFEHVLDELYDMTVLRYREFRNGEGRAAEKESRRPTVFLITDYSKLKNILSDDGKSKLLNMLLHLQGEFEMGAVVCDTEQAAMRDYVAGWRAERCAGKGIYIGSNLTGQEVLPVSRQNRSAVQVQQNAANSCYLVEQGVPCRINPIVTKHRKEGIR